MARRAVASRIHADKQAARVPCHCILVLLLGIPLHRVQEASNAGKAAALLAIADGASQYPQDSRKTAPRTSLSPLPLVTLLLKTAN